MTTGTNEPQSQPVVDPQQQLDPQGQQQQPPAAQDEPAAVVDIDAQALIDAEAEAKAEEAAGQGDDDAGADNGQQPGQQLGPNAQRDQQQQPSGDQPGGDAVMIPKARLDDALAKGAEAREQLAYWRGRAEAAGTGQQTQPGQQQPGQQQQQPTAEQRLAEIGTSIEALAAQFDAGEISMSDFKKRERELTAQEHGIREEALLAKAKPADQASTSNELYLQTLTAQLETQHPWVQVFDQVGSEADWSYVKAQAIDNLTAKGVDPTAGDMGRFQLRQEIAALMDKLGPSLVAERARAKGIAIPGGQQQVPSQGGNQQQQQPRPKLSVAALARQNKLAMVANAPPNVSAMTGTSDDGAGVPSEAAIEAMTDEQIDALPEAVKQKLLSSA